MLFGSIRSENCTAPLNSWGPLCRANEINVGWKGAFVNYYINVTTKGSRVFCRGLGISKFEPLSTCAWQMWDLGSIAKNYTRLLWDNAITQPMIQCLSVNYEATIEWKYSSGNGYSTCVEESED